MLLAIFRCYPYCILLALLDLPRTLIALMAAPIVEWTRVLLGPLCKWLLALQRPVVWECWWCWWCFLLQLMPFPLHQLQLPWRVVFCYPVDAMLEDCAPSLSRPVGVAGSTAASSVGLALWAPGSVP